VFIQMVQGKCSRQDDLHQVVDGWCADMATQPGWLGGTYGFTDDDRFVGVVRYDSMTSCQESCKRPEAAMWWAAAAELFDGTCEIHESEDITMMLDGGSDDAGFVQVMRGKVGDADALRHLIGDQDMTSMLHQARPEILGATLAIESDGSFTETIAFTDETSARRGEQLDMPADAQAEWDRAIAEVQFIDLHRPWFASHE